MIDVRRAATLVGRHPETIRRWVWSGRLVGLRHGRRLLVAQADVESLARQKSVAASLGEWAELARSMRPLPAARSSRSAADLVISDRRVRSGPAESRARR
ncbi:MAG: helix-turn-helix domain-containing protein [Acidobacteria bacterium]|nr:helix-turn-helix domain-containing protein [Acidobacteriota bacterium]